MLNFLHRWFPTQLSQPEQDLLAYLDSNAVLFGSQVWGGATANSDYDYYMSDTVHKRIRSFMNTNNISWSTHDTYNHKFAFDRGTNLYLHDGRKLQLMSYDTQKPDSAFRSAITLMTIVSKQYDVTSKTRRYSYFEGCVDLFKRNTLPINQEVRTVAQSVYPELFI